MLNVCVCASVCMCECVCASECASLSKSQWDDWTSCQAGSASPRIIEKPSSETKWRSTCPMTERKMAARCLCECVRVCASVLVLWLVSEQRVVCLITFCKCLVVGQMTRNVNFQCEWASNNNKSRITKRNGREQRGGGETERIRYVADAVFWWPWTGYDSFAMEIEMEKCKFIYKQSHILVHS